MRNQAEVRVVKTQRVVTRVDNQNPNRNIWNNNGIWFVHFTLHLTDYTKRRVRQSLHTHDVAEARSRRDELFRTLSVETTNVKDVLSLAA